MELENGFSGLKLNANVELSDESWACFCVFQTLANSDALAPLKALGEREEQIARALELRDRERQ